MVNVKKCILVVLLMLALGMPAMADIVENFSKVDPIAGHVKIAGNNGASSVGLVDAPTNPQSLFDWGGYCTGYKNIVNESAPGAGDGGASSIQVQKNGYLTFMGGTTTENNLGSYVVTLFATDAILTETGIAVTGVKINLSGGIASTGRLLVRDECGTNQWYASNDITIPDNSEILVDGLTWFEVDQSALINTAIADGTATFPNIDGTKQPGLHTLSFTAVASGPANIDGSGLYVTSTDMANINDITWAGATHVAGSGCVAATEIVADWLDITSSQNANRVDLNKVNNSSSVGLVSSTGPNDNTPGWGGFNKAQLVDVGGVPTVKNQAIRWKDNSVAAIAGTALNLQGEANAPGTYLLTRFGRELPEFNTIKMRMIRGNDTFRWMVRDASGAQWYASDAGDFRGDLPLDDVIDTHDMTTLNWAAIDSGTSAAFNTDTFPDPNTFDLDALTYDTWANVMDGITIDGGGFYIQTAADMLEINYISFNNVVAGVDNPPTAAIIPVSSPIYLQDYRENGTATLNADVTDENVAGLSVEWAVSGGMNYTFTPDETTLATSIQFGEVGTYVIDVTVNDGVNAPVTSDSITIEVITNIAPTVDAGAADVTVYLNAGGVLALDGTVTDDTLGGIADVSNGYTLSEPNGVAIAIGWESDVTAGMSFDDDSLVDAVATFTATGTYVLTLTADDTVATAVADSITVTVEEKPLSTLTLSGPVVTDDAYTNYSNVDSRGDNEGARLRMETKGEGPGIRKAYIRFDPGTIGGNVRSADLRLRGWGSARKDAGEEGNDYVSAVTYGPSGPWIEGDGADAVENTVPGALTYYTDDLVWGDVLDSKYGLILTGGTDMYHFDVSNYVMESDGTINFGISTDYTASSTTWRPSEDSRPPVLTVIYDPEQANAITPSENATNVHPGTSLVWQGAFVDVTAHEVYFGEASGALTLQDTISADAFSAEIAGEPNLFAWAPAAELTLGIPYFWRIDEVIGGVSVSGEEWTFTVAAVHPDIPQLVSPEDAAIEVSCPAELIWNDGFSADSHDIYISDVAPADVASLIASGTQIAGVDSGYRVRNLDLETEYFWTVVANGTGGPWASSEVRSFTTGTFANLGDLDYDFIWVKETAGFDANSVSVDGSGALSLTYDDADGVASVVSITFPEALDLTGATGRESLVFRLYGQDTNDAEVLSISLSDGATEVSVVAVDVEEVAADLTRPALMGYDLMVHDLDEFAPVNLAAVTKMTVTVGDGAGIESGTIIVDNFNVRTSRCIWQKVAGDIAMGDCYADANDLNLIVKHWLSGETTVDAIPVLPDGLIVQFDFEEVAGPNFYSTVTYDGVNTAMASVEAGKVADLGEGQVDGVATVGTGAIDLTLASIGIVDPQAVLGSLAGEITISMWCYSDAAVLGTNSSVFRAYTDTSTIAMYARIPGTKGEVVFGTNKMGGAHETWDDATPADWSGAWHHYAFVVSAASDFMAIYHNGVMVAQEGSDMTGYNFDVAGLQRFEIGETPYYPGRVDDFRIYNRALDAGEIVTLALGDTASITQVIDTNADVNEDGTVNLVDFAAVASIWLEMVMWP